jgi:hypothetical protein
MQNENKTYTVYPEELEPNTVLSDRQRAEIYDLLQSRDKPKHKKKRKRRKRKLSRKPLRLFSRVGSPRTRESHQRVKRRNRSRSNRKRLSKRA